MKVILVLAALGLALATAFALAARLWWAFDLFSHFRLQYLVLALAFALAALLLRSWPLVAAFALIACIHSFALRDLWLGGHTAAAAEGEPLKIASVNVLRRNDSPDEVLEFARTSDADVLVLIDARGKRWRDTLADVGQIYPHQAPASWRDGAPVILFSRRPIIEESVIRPPTGERPYLAAEIGIGKQTLTVVGVHPTSPKPQEPRDTKRRNLQLDYLADLIEDASGPVVLAGDFNTTPWSPHFGDLVEQAGLRHAGVGHGYIGTWPVGFWPLRIPIDHILIKGPIAATDLKRGPAIGSDHFPIIADLRLVPRP